MNGTRGKTQSTHGAAAPVRAAQRLPRVLLAFFGGLVFALLVAIAIAIALRSRPYPQARTQPTVPPQAAGAGDTAARNGSPQEAAETQGSAPKAAPTGKAVPPAKPPRRVVRRVVRPDSKAPARSDPPPTPEPRPRPKPPKPEPARPRKARALRLFGRDKVARFRREAVHPSEVTPTMARYPVTQCDGVVEAPRPLARTLSFRRDGKGVTVQQKFHRGVGKTTLLRCRFEPEGGLVCDTGAARSSGYEASLRHLVLEAADLASETLYQCMPRRGSARAAEQELVLSYTAKGTLAEPTWRFTYPWPNALRVQHAALHGGRPVPVGLGGGASPPSTPTSRAVAVQAPSSVAVRFKGASPTPSTEALCLELRVGWGNTPDKQGARVLTASLALPGLDPFLATLRAAADRAERVAKVQAALDRARAGVAAARQKVASYKQTLSSSSSRSSRSSSYSASMRRRQRAGLESSLAKATSEAGAWQWKVDSLGRTLTRLTAESGTPSADAHRLPMQCFADLGPLTVLDPWGQTLCTLKPRVQFVERDVPEARRTGPTRPSTGLKVRGRCSARELPESLRGCLRSEQVGSVVTVRHWAGGWRPLLCCTLGDTRGQVAWKVDETAARAYPSRVQNFVLEVVDSTAGASHRCTRPREVARCEVRARYTEAGLFVKPTKGEGRSSFSYPWPETLTLDHAELNGGKPLRLTRLRLGRTCTVAFRRNARFSTTKGATLDLRLSFKVSKDTGSGSGAMEVAVRAYCPDLSSWRERYIAEVKKLAAEKKRLEAMLQSVTSSLQRFTVSSRNYDERSRLTSRSTTLSSELRSLESRLEQAQRASVPSTVFQAFDDIGEVTVRDAWNLPVAVLTPRLERVDSNAASPVGKSSDSNRPSASGRR